MVHPGRNVCLATLSLRIHEPSRETFTSNHVRILLEKQYSLSDIMKTIFKKESTDYASIYGL